MSMSFGKFITVSQKLKGNQQQEELSEQSHVGSEFLSNPLIMPDAQPTPALTEMASPGQLSAQAPHSIQRSRPTICALSPRILNTARGHTTAHKPHPVHFDSVYCNVTTSGRYRKSFIIISLMTKLRKQIGRQSIQANQP